MFWKKNIKTSRACCQIFNYIHWSFLFVCCRYKGYNFPGQIVQSGVLQELPEFEFREDDVLVASFPKTGQFMKLMKNILFINLQQMVNLLNIIFTEK